MLGSLHAKPWPERTVVFGEVGLSGDLRAVAGLERRLAEANRLGFRHAIVPAASRNGAVRVPEGLRVTEATTLAEAAAAAGLT